MCSLNFRCARSRNRDNNRILLVQFTINSCAAQSICLICIGQSIAIQCRTSIFYRTYRRSTKLYSNYIIYISCGYIASITLFVFMYIVIFRCNRSSPTNALVINNFIRHGINFKTYHVWSGIGCDRTNTILQIGIIRRYTIYIYRSRICIYLNILICLKINKCLTVIADNSLIIATKCNVNIVV